MKLLTIFTPLLLASVISFSVSAEVENPHSVGLSISGGGIDYKGKDKVEHSRKANASLTHQTEFGL